MSKFLRLISRTISESEYDDYDTRREDSQEVKNFIYEIECLGRSFLVGGSAVFDTGTGYDYDGDRGRHPYTSREMYDISIDSIEEFVGDDLVDVTKDRSILPDVEKAVRQRLNDEGY